MMTDGDWQQRDPRDERSGRSRRGHVEQHDERYGDRPGGRYDERYDGHHDGRRDGRYDERPAERPRGSRRRNVEQHDYFDYEYTPREHKHPRLRAWAPLGVLLVILGMFGGAVYGGYSYLKSKHHPVADYTTKVCTQDSARGDVEVPSGATQAEIGKLLAQAGIVASSAAYVDAADANQASAGIRAGQYSVCLRIAGSEAVLELLDTKNLSTDSSIEVRSHEWQSEVVAELAAKHKWKVGDVQQAIDANQIGLPPWAQTTDKKWTAEGLLEPGTYQLAPTDTPKSVLSAMVKARLDWLASIDFVNKAKALKCGVAACTPEQVVTIASIAEAEVNQATPDGSEVSEAILARLKAGDTLGVDSTAMYFDQSRKSPSITEVENPKNPYSTYAHKGLPPGPIAVPSRDMIVAILNPTHTGEFFWCSKDGGTRFFPISQQAQRDAYCKTA